MRGIGLALQARSAVRIPSSLVVTTIVACGPQVEPDDESVGDTSEEETSGTTTPDPSTTTDDPSTTTPDPSTTTVDPGTTEATTDDQTTGPIELPDCGMHSYVAECNDEDFCTWQMRVGCVVECPLITDEAQCVSFDHCEWIDTCQFEGAI